MFVCLALHCLWLIILLGRMMCPFVCLPINVSLRFVLLDVWMIASVCFLSLFASNNFFNSSNSRWYLYLNII